MKLFVGLFSLNYGQTSILYIKIIMKKPSVKRPNLAYNTPAMEHLVQVAYQIVGSKDRSKPIWNEVFRSQAQEM